MKKQSRKKGGGKRHQPGVVATKVRAKQSVRQQVAPAVIPPEALELEPTRTTPLEPEPATIIQPIHHRQDLHILLSFGVALASALLLWIAGNLFLSKITVGASTVPARTSNASLEQLVINDAMAYRLHVTYPDSQIKLFSLQDMGMRVNPTDTVSATRKTQRTLTQMLMWWRPVVARVQVEVDAGSFKNFINKNTSIVAQPAHDASLSIVNGATQVTDATAGAQYGLAAPDQTIIAAINHFQTEPLHLQSIPLQPSITASALAAAKAQLDAALRQRISINIGDQTITPSPTDIANWIKITPTATSVNISVDTASVKQYLDDLASSHTQPAHSEITLDTTGEVLSAGTRGVSVGDTRAATDAIAQNLLHGSGSQATLPIQYTAFTTVQAPTVGKWIEVNATTKRMYAYDQGQLVRSFLVSAGASATPTVIGRFAIYSKYRSQDMHGQNVDGSSYFQPAVPYVNYFYNDYAIHGNYWRPASYFGNINSSHGCVGVPVNDGAWIYSWAPIGTPVIVHT
jgi:lipoprotein-anchoring transpeptidase ErfK/SrfK